MMDLFNQFLDYFLRLDVHLNEIATILGPWLYGLLFLIIFCETGLVVTPILPGDSLLFAVGALAASAGSTLSLPALLVLLIAAAILGDAVNYHAGYYIGPKVFKYENSRLLNKKHLLRTQQFYEKYGSKTIVLARFVPIVRTFAPFVAGIGNMRYIRFAIYNILGGVAWVALFLLGGYFLGNLPGIKERFHIIIVAILIISVLPMVYEYFMARRRAAAKEPVAVEAEQL
jgi:membrane-associated protein